jgi:putative membrane protein
MQMRAKSFNPQILLEFLCYASFATLMVYLIKSDKYLSYVTPRMAPYLYFTAIVMSIWALVSLGRLFRPQHKVRSMHCLVLAIPILLLLLPYSPLTASEISSNYSGGNSFASQLGEQKPLPENADVIIPSSKPNESSVPDGTKGQPSESTVPIESIDPIENTNPIETIPTTKPDEPNAWDSPNALPGLDMANKKITVSNDDFGMWLSEIYMNMAQYEGYTIVMTGFVFKDSAMLGEDTFSPARLMMSCCVADLQPAGLLCKYDKISELEQDSWVTVEGTLFIGVYEYGDQQYDDPQIKVTKITPAEAVDGYVYPY